LPPSISLSLSLSFSLSLSVSISFSEPLKSLKRAATEPQDFKRDLREPQYSSKEPQKSLKRAFKEPQKSLSRASKEPQKSLKKTSRPQESLPRAPIEPQYSNKTASKEPQESLTARPYESCKNIEAGPAKMHLGNWYTAGTHNFHPTDFCQAEMKKPTMSSNKSSTA